ncbi:hypothetical protein BKA66DRAFT_470468 [Pyrenochaeta sp. MPI-SDFR-AT-0127]|nr:hypothetical protein BKA66DRAFT_470468 [Pyrenochaeta sp. MPI-SDFR-AT-0127]
MRFYSTYLILPLAALLNASPTSVESPAPEGYDLKLVLEGTGEDAVWRLRDEDIPTYVDTSEEAANFTLTPRDSPAPRGTLDARNKRPWQVNCHDNNQAEAAQCRILMDSIRYSRSPLPRSPRHIAYGGCYISWSAVVNKEQSALYSGALDTLAFCQNGHNGGQPTVSGVAWEYLEVEVTQCLSNRPNGCTY